MRWTRALTTMPVLLMSLCAGPALAQGFMVKPMRIELGMNPGQRVSTRVEFTNMNPQGSIRIRSWVLALVPTEAGGWSSAELDTPEAGAWPRSCASWLELENETFAVARGQRVENRLNIAVPPGARGVYGAVIAAQTVPDEPTPEEGVIKVGLAIRFVIPVFITVQASGMRERVGLGEVGLTAKERAPGGPLESALSLGLVNEGETAPRIDASVQVLRKVGEDWRWVTRANASLPRLLPGATTTLQPSLGRGLPSGEYRLNVALTVNGRPGPRGSATVEFDAPAGMADDGDAAEVALDPLRLDVEVRPGSTRSARIRVTNQSPNPVTVRAGARLPESLSSVMMGELKGEDLGMHEHVTIAPTEFTIPGGRDRVVAVLVAVPRERDQAMGFAEALFATVRSDGSLGPPARALVRVSHPELKPRAALMLERVALVATDEPGQYAISGVISNVGTRDAQIVAEAAVAEFTGRRMTSSQLSAGQDHLLPMSSTPASGVLDFTGIDPRTYLVRVVCRDTITQATATVEFSVALKDTDEGRLVEVLTAEEDDAKED